MGLELPTRGKTMGVAVSLLPTFSTKTAAPFNKAIDLSSHLRLFLPNFHQETSDDGSFLQLETCEINSNFTCQLNDCCWSD